MPGLAPAQRALMLELNTGGVLLVAFAFFASLFCAQDLLTTKLGKTTIILITLFYASRAVEELVLSARFSPIIFGVCLIVAVVYALSILGWLEKRKQHFS
jgi:hypothetical protein